MISLSMMGADGDGGVHLQRYYCVPCVCIEPTGSSLKDPEFLKKIQSESEGIQSL